MKNLTIDFKGTQRNLQYEIFSDVDEYSGVYYWTEFYEGSEVKKRKKFLFWGKTIFVSEPKLIFTLNINVEAINRTKEEIRGLIHKQLELLDRAEQIARGELI